MTTEPKSAMSMTKAEYAESKARITDWRKKPAQPAASFSREKLEAEIKVFEASGLKSVMSDSTSHTASTPPTAKEPKGSPSAHDLSDADWKKARRDIDQGRVPNLNASKQNFA
jgi:hypothetical protein